VASATPRGPTLSKEGRVSRASQSARLGAKRAPRVHRSSKARRAPGRDHGACRAEQIGRTGRARPAARRERPEWCAGVSRCALVTTDAHHETPASFHCRRRGGEGLAGGGGPARQVHPASVAPVTLGARASTKAGTKRAGFPRCALRSPGRGWSSLRPRSHRFAPAERPGMGGEARESATASAGVNRELN